MRASAGIVIALGAVVSAFASFAGRIPAYAADEQEARALWRAQWERDRENTLEWFRENFYGHDQIGRPDDLKFGESEITCAGGRIRIPLEVHLPKGASAAKPAPVFVLGDHRRKSPYPNVPVDEILARGYALVRYNFNSVAPDLYVGDTNRVAGVFAVYGGWDKPNGWGKVAAWAWGFSRVMDWIETRPELDAKRVAIVGHSRGGKTTLWAAANDKRIALACVNNSGTGGAHLNASVTPMSEQVAAFVRAKSWNFFCPNFLKLDGRETRMAHDADDLIRCVAPRLCCVASASEDPGAGPQGEFEATRRASDAWLAYGERGLSLTAYPPPGTIDQTGKLAWHLRAGQHELAPWDWMRYLDFADKWMK